MPKPSGVTLTRSVERDGETQRDVLTCCHCGYSWEVIPGSGRVRGFCQGGQNCPGGVTCGRPVCEQRNNVAHLPAEAWVEAQEGTRAPSKIIVPVGVNLS